MRIVIIPGSLRAAANSRLVLAAAVEELTRAGNQLPNGIEIELYDGYGELPIFNEELESAPPAAVSAMRSQLAQADGVMFVTPEYNASIPGGLKNAVDWASRPAGESVLGGLPSAVISNSDSPFGATWAGEHLRRALTFAASEVTDSELAIGQVSGQFSEGQLTNEETREKIAALVAELIAAVSAKLGLESDLSGASTT